MNPFEEFEYYKRQEGAFSEHLRIVEIAHIEARFEELMVRIGLRHLL